ncbi:MAG: PAS domain-containing sensor histidine kinase [bacterium]|nr:PAS domain-containing sensor histidine kinase [bacterium]
MPTINSPPTQAIILRYGALLEQARDLITVMNLDGYYIAASRTVKEVFGLSDETLTSFSYRNVLPPDEIAKAEAVYKRLIGGEDIPTYERTFLRHDGVPFIGEVNVTLIRDEKGNPHEILSIIRDITERKRIENELLEKRLLDVRLQKEQELSQMRADLLMKINHEFRTPLAIINTYVSLMERHFERLSSERRNEYLVNVRDNVHRISDMLDDLYVIYQTQSGFHKERELVNMVKLTEDTVAQLISTEGSEHDIVMNIQGTIPPFLGYERLLWYMAYNVLHNAVYYSAPESQVTITLRCEVNKLVFIVRDHGIGIAEHEQGRIFEPFFRGENVGVIEGTGLGLSVVQEAVRAHEGILTLESELGVGTTVIIMLPVQ